MNLRDTWINSWAVVRAAWYLRSATSVKSLARVWGRPSIRNSGQLVIGERFRLVSDIARTEIVSGPQGKVEIGDRVYINYGCSISAQELVRIGSDASIGTHCILMDNDFHSIHPALRNEMPPSQPIILEENVWLGSRVIVLHGVTIGRDSVIGAGSVVTRDIPPGCVAAGLPAKVIREIEPHPVQDFELLFEK